MMIPYKIQQVKKCEDLFKQEWNGKFKCSFCESVFTDIPGKKRHEKVNHIEKGVLHKCSLCEKTYLSFGSMKRHIRINHNSVASVCEEQTQHTL